jgi:2-polyprenyl-3-methyl-5-hydroxy-6-metoxy-1,4-benzoquinol methylase
MDKYEKDIRSKLKSNVDKFNLDVQESHGYKYTSDKLSSSLANQRISKGVADCIDFFGKNVLDLGCGDGTYTREILALDVSSIVGVDPAEKAIRLAIEKLTHSDLKRRASFIVGDLYDLASVLDIKDVNVIVLRGVLHHLSEPEKALLSLSGFQGELVILEPNGLNPIVKLLEKTSRYHIEHEEQSFSQSELESWLEGAGFEVTKTQFINLVPFFCPDVLAKLCLLLQPLIEKIPLASRILCGQILIVAKK